MTPDSLSPTDRTTVRRGKHRARADRDELFATLDAGLVCHLGVVVDGVPRVLPTSYGRIGDTLYLHGSSGARSLRESRPEDDICVTVTLLDGLVYARAVFHCSMNYRCAMIYGRPRTVTDSAEKLDALRAITEHLQPGVWEHARKPSTRELAATSVLALPLAEASVKIRAGDPGDDPEDVAAGAAWAGVVPLTPHAGEPIPAPDLVGEHTIPTHVIERTA